MKAYKWIVCILLVFAIGFGVLVFGNFQSDESTLQQQPAITTETKPASESVTEFTFSAADYSAQLLQILNAYRQRSSLPVWISDEKLTTAAATRADECAILQSKTHTRSDGSDWFTVLDIDENFNYLEITGIGSQTPADMARTWIASESINAQLMSAEYTACGLNCSAVGSDVYVVLILYKP